ncbi:hypothetical protein [Sphingomonas xinjiangensis]|uniref:Uncharacterized protein n=1 Tax=Sphingomonas xinjiangensis TaxID=643568 RepID=A0A840YT11_9SPHN|nr:hypothetical protein [Sphingomonas xinjiangensis]MBB5712792.1 hypothetical protein [Sphingomonas xinjiangensis]
MGMMIRALIAPVALFSIASASRAAEEQQSTAAVERAMVELQASHIAANAPPDASFMTVLHRDVLAYLAANGLPSESAEIELLRKGATQSGVSYPKYYLWVRATDKAGHQIAGAMRVTAIDSTRFDVTDFTPAASIRSDPASLASIYPALLIPGIRQHATTN